MDGLREASVLNDDLMLFAGLLRRGKDGLVAGPNALRQMPTMFWNFGYSPNGPNILLVIYIWFP